MNSALIQLLVLAGIAIFLILKLRSVLGTREGFEKPPLPPPEAGATRTRRDFEVIDGGQDRDITDHVPDGSPAAKALAGMKLAEPGFSVTTFLEGARGAYEMIVIAYEKGDIAAIKPFLAPEVYDAFAGAVEEREKNGLTVQADFKGIKDLALTAATYDRSSREAEVSVRFTGELTSVVRDRGGQIVEGSATEIKRQRDVWTFARTMGANDPNWILVATGE
jgi:predicted lipid-binding transport protein (Tim44 family)